MILFVPFFSKISLLKSFLSFKFKLYFVFLLSKSIFLFILKFIFSKLLLLSRFKLLFSFLLSKFIFSPILLSLFSKFELFSIFSISSYFFIFPKLTFSTSAFKFSFSKSWILWFSPSFTNSSLILKISSSSIIPFTIAKYFFSKIEKFCKNACAKLFLAIIINPDVFISSLL